MKIIPYFISIINLNNNLHEVKTSILKQIAIICYQIYKKENTSLDKKLTPLTIQGYL